jgi:hypothetical protein
MAKDFPERKCAYSGCGVVFKPKRAWAIFHTRECQQLSYIDRTRGAGRPEFVGLRARIVALEIRVKSLEEKP